MRWIFGWWQRLRKLHDSARWKDATATRQVQEADLELEESRELLRQARKEVAPLTTIYERNQFSDIIRDALAAGYDKPSKRGRR